MQPILQRRELDLTVQKQSSPGGVRVLPTEPYIIQLTNNIIERAAAAT
jgi:hypothetical protein